MLLMAAWRCLARHQNCDASHVGLNELLAYGQQADCPAVCVLCSLLYSRTCVVLHSCYCTLFSALAAFNAIATFAVARR